MSQSMDQWTTGKHKINSNRDLAAHVSDLADIKAEVNIDQDIQLPNEKKDQDNLNVQKLSNKDDYSCKFEDISRA